MLLTLDHRCTVRQAKKTNFMRNFKEIELSVSQFNIFGSLTYKSSSVMPKQKPCDWRNFIPIASIQGNEPSINFPSCMSQVDQQFLLTWAASPMAYKILCKNHKMYSYLESVNIIASPKISEGQPNGFSHIKTQWSKGTNSLPQ